MINARDWIAIAGFLGRFAFGFFHLNELVVLLVAANPNPLNCVAERLANGTVMVADAD
jgi:hypothetical protein